MSNDEKNEDKFPFGNMMRKIDAGVYQLKNGEYVQVGKMNEMFPEKSESESNKHKELEEVTKDTKNDGVKNDK